MRKLDYLEKVKEKLWATWYTKELSDSEFDSIKKNLDRIYNETKSSECLLVISELYIHRMNSCRRNAEKYAVEGIESDYNNSNLHDNYNLSNNGIMVDFKKRNHNKLIEYYQKFIKKHRDSFIARRILIENLIDNYRLDEAEKEIYKAYKIEDEKIYCLGFYEGEIMYKRGYIKEAEKKWNEICENNKDNFMCSFMLGEEYANFGQYDKSIKYYEKSFHMQSVPRRIDSLESLINIYEIKKDYEKVLEIVNLILQVYKDDYNIKEGDEIERYLEYRTKLLHQYDYN